MPTLITDESYNGQGSLIANAGDWVPAVAKFSMRFSKGSGVSNTVTYQELGSQYSLTFQQGDWGDEGFAAGDNITLSFNYLAFGTIPIIWNAQVDYINGTTMYLVNPLPAAGPFTFPTSGLFDGLLVVADKLPEAVEFEFNLAPNGSNLLNSVIDNQVNRFEYQPASGLSVGVPAPMTQVGDKSGGFIKDVELTYNGSPGDFMRDFTITYKFFQWGILQEAQEPPTYYDGTAHLAPIIKIRNFSQYGNPNGVVEQTSTNVQGNTGFFDENRNGGANNYTPQSIDFFDALGNPIDAPDYSGPSTFIAVVDAPNQNNPSSTYRIGLAFRPIDGSEYQGKTTNLGQNLLINAPDQDYIADGSTAAGPFLGETNDQGARWDFENLKFELTGPTELTITGKITPNAQCQAYFDQFPDGERRTTLWTSIGNFNLPFNTDDRVSLRLFDDDNIDAPTVGVQIPNVISEKLLDHAGNDITSAIPQTTTEDDVLYTSNLRLINNVEYEGMRTRIWVENTATGEEFTLEDQFFAFDAVNAPLIGGQYQVNINQPRGFNLPPASDRNKISIQRNTGLDVAGFYGITIDYGFLNDWRYWEEQTNVDNAFFDALEQFNGKNKNWQRFYLPPDWILNVSYYTQVDGVQDFNNFKYGIRPYEDDPTVSVTRVITDVATGNQPTNFIANNLHELAVTFQWNLNFDNEWVEFTIEDFESGNRWVISSVLDHGGVAQNPFQPLTGETKLKLTPAGNTLKAECLVDTNLVNVEKCSLSYRVFSDPKEGDFLITQIKDASAAYSLRKVSSNNVYPDTAPCIRVRRSDDNAEADIGFINNGGELILNEDALLNFVNETGPGDGRVVVWYDQSGDTRHARQNAFFLQPFIVIAGAVVKDPTNNKAAIDFNGINHYFDMDLQISVTQKYYCGFVFSRPGFPVQSVGVGSQPTPTPLIWDTADDVRSDMGNPITHANDSSSGTFVFTMQRDGNDDVTIWKDGVAYPSGNAPSPVGPLLQVGITGAANHHGGLMQELIYWAKDKSADQATIEGDQLAYY